MYVDQLVLTDLRCFEALKLVPSRSVNVLLGDNGSGKTSILEALYVLSHGRSFRAGGGAAALIRRGQTACTVHAVLGGAQQRRLGLTRTAHTWRARIDGQPAVRLSALLGLCPVICVEPGSQALIVGPAELRRRFLDWGVFHVEPGFVDVWQRHRRALQQRNALLRTAVDDRQMRIWEQHLAQAGQELDVLRRAYLERWREPLTRYLSRWLPELGAPQYQYQRGWAAASELDTALRSTRDRDRVMGFTRAGPQRADWALTFSRAPERHQLSRGQTKLVALACMLAQFEVYRSVRGDAPVLLLDDLASELDRAHGERVLDQVLGCGAQVWISGTTFPWQRQFSARVFHVEHGAARCADGPVLAQEAGC